MKSKLLRTNLLMLLTILFLMLPLTSGMAEVKGSFLYKLSNFTGTIPFSWVRVALDKEMNEIYVVDSSEGAVHIFNNSGMEIYNFGDDGSIGYIYDIAVEEDGNLLVLSYRPAGTGLKSSILRCNYRGEEISEIEIKNLPSGFSEFSPTQISYREGHLYMIDKNQMKVLVTDKNGLFENGYDLASIIGLDEKKRADTGIVGFSIDREGNMFFTIPPLFKAYKLSPDRALKTFGQRGSAPGKFNIVAGIASDDKGYVYVTDTLKCAVMVFDKDFNFMSQFGYRGYDQGGLIAPRELAVDGVGRIYVVQSARRGVSVFQVTYNGN